MTLPSPSRIITTLFPSWGETLACVSKGEGPRKAPLSGFPRWTSDSQTVRRLGVCLEILGRVDRKRVIGRDCLRGHQHFNSA